MTPPALNGPADTLGPGLHRLAPGVWLTDGRTVVVEGDNGLALVDPGDEPWADGDAPIGPLAQILALCGETGKQVRQVWVTHAHPDHVANLPLLREFAGREPALEGFALLAHAATPLKPDVALSQSAALEGFPATAHPTPGHTPWGDDLSFHLPAAKLLLSGDLVQPKGEHWEQAFYPSPYPFFTDGGTYLESLDRLLALEFDLLVTGHREVRFAPDGRRWVELTRHAIAEVGRRVTQWAGADDLQEAARTIFLALCRERGIDEAAIARRMAPGPGGSGFDKFDLPGIAWYWNHRHKGSHCP